MSEENIIFSAVNLFYTLSDYDMIKGMLRSRKMDGRQNLMNSRKDRKKKGRKRSATEWIALIANGVVMAVFFACVFVLFLYILGTMVPSIPYFSARASYTTVGQAHLFFPLVVFVFFMSFAFFLAAHRRGSEGRVISYSIMAVSSATLIMTLIVTGSVLRAVRQAGSSATLGRCYSLADTSGVEKNTVTYSEHKGHSLRMDLYTYSAAQKTGRPIVIFIHGGGWIYGSRRNHAYYAMQFARKGCLAVNVDYTMSTYKRHMAGEEKKTKDENGSVAISVVGTTAEKEIIEAIAYLTVHANDYGGDPENIFLYGDSAGGNLALDVAFKIMSGHYGAAKIRCGDGKTRSVKLPAIRAVSAEYPVADPVSFWEDPDPYFAERARRMVYSYTGGTPWSKAAVYDSITPAEFVTEDAPPTLLMAGEGDKFVQPQATYDLADTLAYLGVDSRLIRIPYANHAFDREDGSIMSQAYFELTWEWFRSHFN